GYRVGLADLPVVVLKNKGARPVQYADAPGDDRRGVAAGREPQAAGLDADEPHAGVVDERAEDPDRVGAAADAGDDDIGEAAEERAGLLLRLAPDHRLEVSDHGRVRVRPDRGAEQVVRGADVRDPVADRL